VCGVSTPAVGRWRRRFCELRLDGLCDEPRPGSPPSITVDQFERAVVDALESAPKDATHRSRTKMTERFGVSRSAIGRVCGAFGLKPHLADTRRLSIDPLSVEKAYDTVGLYLNPPELAVVYCEDHKSQPRALARSHPTSPMMPGMPQKRTRGYLRHGTTPLFTAFNTSDATVIVSVHRRHRTIEFKRFLAKLDAEVPHRVDVHRTCDNCGTHTTPAIKRRLARHAPFHTHYTPTYSDSLALTVAACTRSRKASAPGLPDGT
jgi:hypothetical protein